MKKAFGLSLLIVALALSTAPRTLFAQAADTVVVAALPPGNLNEVINADTLSNGALPPNTVFLLKPTGTLDTTYYLTATIQVRGNVTIVGYINPNTGHPPVIAPFINSDNSSPGTFIEMYGGDTLNLNGVYLLGTRTDGSSVTGQCVGAGGDSVTFIFNDCVFDHFGSSGTPNVINTWASAMDNIYVTNCEFRNNQDDVPQNPGLNWAGPGPSPFPVDSVKYVNNTMFILGGCIEGSGQDVHYMLFDHNTVFFQTKTAPFTLQEWHNADVKNNIFFSCNSTGLDTAHVYDANVQNSNFFSAPAIIELDTLANGVDSALGFTEADRHVAAVNNAYFWPKGIVDNWATLNQQADTTYGQIITPSWAAATYAPILTDRTKWPGIDVYTNDDSVDPGFNSVLVQMCSDSMANFVDTCWAIGTGLNTRPFVYSSSNPKTWTGVPSDWQTVQGYPVRENLAYTNTSLMHAGTDGFALGDLNWFPSQKAQFVLGIKTVPNVVPEKFALSQNYPNPFNPSTDIQVSLKQAGNMSLTIYNVLGQVVQVVDHGYRPAGEYIFNVSMDRYASGVYFYTLREGSNSITKKMLLLK